MVPTGPLDMNGTSQPVPASLLRSSSGLLGTQNGANAIPSQSSFSSILSPRAQFNNTNMISNVPNVSSLVHQSFGNGGPNAGPGNVQRGMIENRAERDSVSAVGNGISFNSQQSFVQSNIAIPGSSGHMQGQQFLNPLDQQSRQFEARNFQLNQQQLQQLSAPQNQSNFNSVKLEPQQIPQAMRSVKTELQQPDQSLFIQPQQQQILQMSRSSPQAPINLLHQQRLFQYQQQQQQQLALKSLPLRHPSQTTLQPQSFPLRPPPKSDYEPGMGARRLMRYMYEQRQRPEDNNIEFWRKFVAEFFAPNAKKKWCVSMYGSGRQTTGVLPQDVWQCEICNCKPGRGFEATTEVLPRLFKIKYESGTLEEFLYIDMPEEYQNSAGQIILDYAKAIQESVFDQLRVVRDGQLRIVFSPDLKICSWEFCARRHDELIPRRSLIPQVSQLGAAAQKYQTSTQAQSASSNSSATELQNNCNSFVASAKQVAKALEVPLVNDLGYSKRYVRCLQISEVVNSMKDLIDYSRETATGPMGSLAKFPRRTSTQSVDERQQLQPPPQQHTMVQTSINDQTSQENSANGVPMSANHSLTSAPPTSSAKAMTGLLHQNSMTSRPQYPITTNTNSLLPNTTPSNNGPQNLPNISIQRQALSGDDSQSSVQKIINQMITNTQPGMGTFGNNMQSVNRVIPTINGTSNSVRGSMENNLMTMNGRVGTSHQQGLGGTPTNGLGAVNGYNNLQFDWKPSP